MEEKKIAADSIQILFENLEKKLSDTEWVATQEPEFINLLNQIGNVIQNLSAQIYIFIDLYQQYVMAMQSSPLFSAPDTAKDADHGNVSPTQTSAAAPANREQRRSQAKAEKKLLTPPAKKLIIP